ncbi:MAG TPA: IS1595 family transposase [Rhizomicrobium sp.]|nr:IS1595 family transposase [Rhizomicrobium sp.]
MSQHFLLSAKARTLSLAQVARMTEEEARDTFRKLRWADNGGEPYCPRCGCLKVKALATRPVWQCGGCTHQFSVTSGTIFADRKRPVRDYLLAIAIFANGAKGHSALQLSRDLDCQYKTAFVLAHKLREAMKAEQDKATFNGTCEVDGAYFGGTIRKENIAAERTDRRAAENQTGKKQVVVVIRERKGRTLPFIGNKESDAIPEIRARVPFGATVHADESRQWDSLHAHYDMKRINHSEAYSKDGACTNQAESFFSRLRRAEIGIHHRVSGKYLGFYASEMAWREDRSRVSNGAQFQNIAATTITHPMSRNWRGYWNRSAA